MKVKGLKTVKQGARRSAAVKKGKIIPFEFDQPVDSWLRDKNAKTGAPMIRIVQDLLKFRMQFKDSEWPPKI